MKICAQLFCFIKKPKFQYYILKLLLNYWWRAKIILFLEKVLHFWAAIVLIPIFSYNYTLHTMYRRFFQNTKCRSELQIWHSVIKMGTACSIQYFTSRWFCWIQCNKNFKRSNWLLLHLPSSIKKRRKVLFQNEDGIVESKLKNLQTFTGVTICKPFCLFTEFQCT